MVAYPVTEAVNFAVRDTYTCALEGVTLTETGDLGDEPPKQPERSNEVVIPTKRMK